MGLDMYLSVREYVNRIDWSKGYEDTQETPQFREVVDTLGMRELLEHGDTSGMYFEIPVMYWRKANQVHKWFVDTRADGVDDCRPISVHIEHLEELLELCDKELSKENEPGLYLPTEGGFFFGSTEYDEYYFQDLEYTKERLSTLIPMMKKSDNDWAVYQASW